MTAPSVLSLVPTRPRPTPVNHTSPLFALSSRVVFDCAVLLVAACIPAHAFRSMLPNEHADITVTAAIAEGWNGEAARQLAAFVRAVDYIESDSSCFGTERHPSAAYSGSHHFDRNPPLQNAAAFTAGRNYVQNRLALAIQEGNAGHGELARNRAAQGLHALQDLFSHSNYVDLGAEFARTTYAAIWNAGAPSIWLQLTAYNAAPARYCTVAGLPGGSFQHNNEARDSLGENASSSGMITIDNAERNTRFFFAKREAIAATRDFLDRLNRGLTFPNGVRRRDLRRDADSAARLNAVRTAPADQPGLDEGYYEWASLQPYNTLGFTVSSHGNTVVFPPASFSLAEEVRAGMLAMTSVGGHDDTVLITPSGELVAVFREIRPEDMAFSPPAEVHIEFDRKDVNSLRAGTLAVFFAHPRADHWQRVVEAEVDESHGTADFLAHHGGVYAIGGVPRRIPSDPGCCQLAADVCDETAVIDCAVQRGQFHIDDRCNFATGNCGLSRPRPSRPLKPARPARPARPLRPAHPTRGN